MRCSVTIFLEEDGEASCEDEGNTDTNRGDLVPLETCGLGVGLGGGLEGQNTYVTGTRSVERESRGRVAKYLPYATEPMARLCSKGWYVNQPREAGSLPRMIAHVTSAKIYRSKGDCQTRREAHARVAYICSQNTRPVAENE